MSKRSADNLVNCHSSNNSIKKSKLFDENDVMKFNEISPAIQSWTFKGRVINKSNINNYKNGKYMSIDIIDSSGEIRCVGFQNTVDKFYSLIEVSKVYTFKNIDISVVNLQYSNNKNNYELRFNENTEIVECVTNNFPREQYKFITLMDLSTLNKGDIVDVFGIISSIYQLEEIKSNFVKRDVIIKDEFENRLTLVFWGENAKNFCGEEKSIIIIKGGKINDYKGNKSLSILSSSIMKFNDTSISEVALLKDKLKLENVTQEEPPK